MKTIRGFQESPANVPGPLYCPLVEKFFLPNFIIFAQNIFHHFVTFLRSFSTLWRQNAVILYRSTSIHIQIKIKKIIAKINLPLQKTSQINNENLRLTPKICRSKLASHPTRITQKLYESIPKMMSIQNQTFLQNIFMKNASEFPGRPH